MLSKNRLAPLLTAIVVSGSLVASARDANACSPPSCTAARSAPRAVGSGGALPVVPSNTQAFPFFPSQGQLELPDGGDPALRLLDPSGHEVAATIQDDPTWPGNKLFVPSAPLTAGTGYKLTYIEGCTASPGDAGPEIEVPFDVGAESALPTAPAALVTEAPVVGSASLVTSAGSCFEDVEAVSVEVRVTPSAELRAFAPLTRLQILVDGQPHGSAGYGTAASVGADLVVGKVYAACKPNEHPGVSSLTLGVHTISVRAHVAGAASDAPELTQKVMFSCTGETLDGDAGPDVDAGPSGAGAKDGSPDGDWGVLGGDEERPSPGPQDDGGCSSTGKSTGTFGSGFVLLAGAIVAMRARMRRRYQH